MRSVDELRDELEAAAKKCELADQRKMRNVGNCPSDLQAYDETWREYKRIHYQLTQAIKAKQDACQHRWEETVFAKAYWQPNTHQYTCRRCNDMRMIKLETSE